MILKSFKTTNDAMKVQSTYSYNIEVHLYLVSNQKRDQSAYLWFLVEQCFIQNIRLGGNSII